MLNKYFVKKLEEQTQLKYKIIGSELIFRNKQIHNDSYFDFNKIELTSHLRF